MVNSQNELAKTEASPLKAANDRFKEAIAGLLDRKKNMVAEALQFRYDVGLVAKRLMDDSNKAKKERYYGSHTVANLALKLGDSESTLNLCLKFVSKIEPGELKQLQEKDWPWRCVTSLLSLEKPEDRKKFRTDWEAGVYAETGSEGLKSDIAEHNQVARKTGERTDNRGNRSPYLTPVKSAETIVTQAASTTLPEFVHTLKELAKHKGQIEEKKLGAIKEHVDGVSKLIPATRKLLDDAEKAIKETGL